MSPNPPGHPPTGSNAPTPAAGTPPARLPTTSAPAPAAPAKSLPVKAPFVPAQHRLWPQQRYFEDFELGETFVLPSRTMTDAHFAAFSLASGDNHPVHYDLEYCRSHGMPQMLAHGFQVLIQTAAGAGLFPHMVEDSLKGFIEQSSRFLNPVFVGDTLYAELVVSELKAGRTTGVLTLSSYVRNQHGLIVLDGVQRYLLRMRPS